MKATLLGSGDPLGMPVPMCGCEYCKDGPERLRAGLMVETKETTLVFDAGPDIRQQLLETGVEEADAFFATHCHFDHFGGLPELHTLDNFTDSEINLYGSEAVEEYIEDVYNWIDIKIHRTDRKVEFEDLEVHPFEVEHSEFLPMQGFSIEKENKKIVYIPDLKRLPENEKYKDADILFVDGMYLFEKHVEEDEDHASGKELKKQIEKIKAEKVILLGISEHFNQMTLQQEEEATEYEIGGDFQVYNV